MEVGENQPLLGGLHFLKRLRRKLSATTHRFDKFSAKLSVEHDVIELHSVQWTCVHVLH